MTSAGLLSDPRHWYPDAPADDGDPTRVVDSGPTVDELVLL